MNLFDAVPFFVDQELGYEVDEENISSYEVRRVFNVVVDNCDILMVDNETCDMMDAFMQFDLGLSDGTYFETTAACQSHDG